MQLGWQRDLKGEKDPCEEFKDDVLGMQELGVFGWMKKGNSFIQLIHSPARFSGLGASSDLRGQAIGFVGDRDVFGN